MGSKMRFTRKTNGVLQKPGMRSIKKTGFLKSFLTLIVQCLLSILCVCFQSQCLVNVYGDVVQVLYDTELQPVPDSKTQAANLHQNAS